MVHGPRKRDVINERVTEPREKLLPCPVQSYTASRTHRAEQPPQERTLIHELCKGFTSSASLFIKISVRTSQCCHPAASVQKLETRCYRRVPVTRFKTFYRLFWRHLHEIAGRFTRIKRHKKPSDGHVGDYQLHLRAERTDDKPLKSHKALLWEQVQRNARPQTDEHQQHTENTITYCSVK